MISCSCFVANLGGDNSSQVDAGFDSNILHRPKVMWSTDACPTPTMTTVPTTHVLNIFCVVRVAWVFSKRYMTLTAAAAAAAQGIFLPVRLETFFILKVLTKLLFFECRHCVWVGELDVY